MHYKNGRVAKVGDMILAKNHNGIVSHEVVVAQSSASDKWDLTTVPVGQTMSRTAKECLHIEDAHNLDAPAATPAAV